MTRRQEGSITEVERRHMAQQGDERTYYITGGTHFLEDDAPAYAEPQSVAHWTLEHDGQDRLSAGSLLKRFASLAGTEDSLDATQTVDYHASGYPERMRVASALTGDFGYRGSIEARCRLVSACEDRPIAADGIPTHLTCLSSSADDFGPAPLLTLPRNRFVPPPLDRLPALRRRARSFSELRLDPPTPRELVGY